jgi:hypothetical protein
MFNCYQYIYWNFFHRYFVFKELFHSPETRMLSSLARYVPSDSHHLSTHDYHRY